MVLILVFYKKNFCDYTTKNDLLHMQLCTNDYGSNSNYLLEFDNNFDNGIHF